MRSFKGDKPMPKKKRSQHPKKKITPRSGKRKKAKKSPSQKGRRKSAKRSVSVTSGGSSISTVTKKKKKWTDMQIFRVPLDPSQAVLSCCDSLSRLAPMLSPARQCKGGSTCLLSPLETYDSSS